MMSSSKKLKNIRNDSFGVRWKKNYDNNKYIYLMLIPVLLYYMIFSYAPMVGVVTAFQDYNPFKRILQSDWVGFTHFTDFLSGQHAWRVIRNTVLLNVYALIFGFPAPIFLALFINEIKSKSYKKIVQTVSYMPHFISVVVICGLVLTFSQTDGLFNDFLSVFGIERTNLFTNQELFRTIYTVSGIWQNIGWSSIIYLATLSSVDPSLHEAASMDGAGRLRRMINISFPALMPVVIVQLIMRLGNIMSQGFEKVILLYNPLIFETSDIISSYVYRRGLEEANYSFGTAVGVFNSVINMIILVTANYISRRVTEESLW